MEEEEEGQLRDNALQFFEFGMLFQSFKAFLNAPLNVV